MVKPLIAKGADVNAVGKYGRTPLMEAENKGGLKI
jgi:ankyrin repeat protein